MDTFFTVELHGEYFANNGKEKVLRPYTASFRLPSADKALGVIKGKLLPPFLMKKDPSFTGIYTHIIDNISCQGRKLNPNEIPVRFQNKEQLKEYIKFHSLGIDVEEYGSVGLLRDHVRMAKEEPENFPKVQADFVEKKLEEKALYDLNADVLGPTHTVPPPVEKPVTVAPVVSPVYGLGAQKGAKLRKVKPQPSPSTEDLLG